MGLMNVIWRCKTVTFLAIGARFDDRVIGNPAHFSQNPRKIIHMILTHLPFQKE